MKSCTFSNSTFDDWQTTSYLNWDGECGTSEYPGNDVLFCSWEQTVFNGNQRELGHDHSMEDCLASLPVPSQIMDTVRESNVQDQKDDVKDEESEPDTASDSDWDNQPSNKRYKVIKDDGYMFSSNDVSNSICQTKQGPHHADNVMQEIYAALCKYLPFLIPRPFIKKEWRIFLFLAYTMDDCLCNLWSMDNRNHIATMPDMTVLPKWNDILKNSPNMPIFWTRVLWSGQNLDVYYDRNTSVVHLIKFVMESKQYVAYDNPVDVAEFKRFLHIPKNTKLILHEFPLLCNMEVVRGRKPQNWFASSACKKQHPQLISFETQIKLWSMTFLFLCERLQKLPLSVYLDIFASQEVWPSNYLVLAAQSLIHHIMQHCAHLFTTSKTNHPKKQTPAAIVQCAIQMNLAIPADILSSMQSAYKLCMVKRATPRKKLGFNRVGKFKGRKKDKMFCIAVNNQIGVLASYESICSMNLCALLVHATKIPRESEVHYEDLHARLPYVFPKSQAAKFLSNFEVSTLFLKTCDPLRLFSPLIYLLCPTVTSIEDLFRINANTYKIELKIESGAANPECGRFIDALELSAKKPHENLCDWVNVLHVDGTSTGIYYKDKHHSLCQAQTEVVKARSQQFLNQFNLVRVVVQEQEDDDAASSNHEKDEGTKDTTMPVCNLICQYQLQTKPQLTATTKWAGDRDKGLAVRRRYKDGSIQIRTFVSLEAFEIDCRSQKSKVDLAQRLFALVDMEMFTRDIACEAAQASLMQFDALQKELASTNWKQQLVVVDDIGKPRLYLLGNIPRQHPYANCRECNMFEGFLPAQMSDMDFLAEWLQAVQQTNAVVTEIVDMNQIAFERFVVSMPDLALVQNDSRTTFQDCFKHAKEKVARRVIGAVHNTSLKYFRSYRAMIWEIQNKIATECNERGCAYTIKKNMHNLQFTQLCLCCTAKHCLRAITSILFLLDLNCAVHSVSTTIEELTTQTLVSPTFEFPIGLCCAHDWTAGTGPMHFQISAQPYHDKHLNFDEHHVIITNTRMVASSSSSKCRFLFIS